ncbi:MAG: DUF2062 domain-containing protein [Luteitalea sp.]|nr:DUF2062 domain-containing protein [Luteitalea sp.]
MTSPVEARSPRTTAPPGALRKRCRVWRGQAGPVGAACRRAGRRASGEEPRRGRAVCAEQRALGGNDWAYERAADSEAARTRPSYQDTRSAERRLQCGEYLPPPPRTECAWVRRRGLSVLMAVDLPSPGRIRSRALTRAGRFHRVIYDLRTEGTSRRRDAAAVGLGVFLGCSPFWGLHLALCWIAGRLLGLNRLKLYLAANLANPFVAPFLLFAEVQTGAVLRRGAFYELSLEGIKREGPWVFGGDFLLGSLVVGGALGLLAALVTYLTVGRASHDPGFSTVVREAADRFLPTGITAWEFARGKLRNDPVYREVLCGGWLPSGGTLVDVGCGQGLMLALLADARQEMDEGQWPETLPPPPRFDGLVGIELRRRVARIAQRALEQDATIIQGDVRNTLPCENRVVICFDVLHLMSAEDQDRVLAGVGRALEPGGMLVVREADAAGGWRFQMVRAGNWLKAIAIGRWRQRFHFRSADDWRACLERHGLVTDIQPMGHGTPFANVLLRATRHQGSGDRG